MKPALLLAGLCVFGPEFALRSEASEAVEGYDAKAAAAFDLLNEIHPPSLNDAGIPVVPAQTPLPPDDEPTPKTVRLRGQIILTGSAYVPFGSAVVTLIGDGVIHDEAGQFSQEVRFTWTQTFPVSNGFISGVADPMVSVQISKDGRMLGSVQLRGMIPVSGTDSAHMATLSGSGFLEGDLQIAPPESGSGAN